MSEVMPIKIYKDRVEIANELNVPKGNIANLTVGGTANIGNKIVLGVAEDGNAALSIAANGITVGDNIIIGSDGNITANSFIGKSFCDENGNNILEPYATKEKLNTDVGALSTNISSVDTALSNYKDEVSDTYALKTEIPSLSGYATETFVNTKLTSYVPTSRTINSKALTGNITLGAGDVGALSKGSGIICRICQVDNISASGEATVSGTAGAAEVPGYYPLAVVFARTGSGSTTSSVNSSFVQAYRADISGYTISYNFRNFASGAAKFTAYFYVLYIQA